jgi:hypothetical protein
MAETVRAPDRATERWRSRVASWVTLTTEGRSGPAIPFGNATLPGLCTSFTLEVTAATVTVLKPGAVEPVVGHYHCGPPLGRLPAQRPAKVDPPHFPSRYHSQSPVPTRSLRAAALRSSPLSSHVSLIRRVSESVPSSAKYRRRAR